MILRFLLRKDIFSLSPENSLTILLVCRKKERETHSSPMKTGKKRRRWKRERGKSLYQLRVLRVRRVCECETCYQVVSVRICTKPYRHTRTRKKKRRVRVARAARFYRFRASACSRAAANCSLMQASERVAFLGRTSRKSQFRRRC